jgi:CRISPR/Cas system-associated protein Cas5 (RAMP superfamily)
MFLPAVILILLREKLVEKTERKEMLPFMYGAAVTYINGVMWFVLAYVIKNNTSVESKINEYNDFAFKYIVMSVVLAVAEPLVEKLGKKLLKKKTI